MKRTFKVEDLHVIQEPKLFLLGEFSSRYGEFEVKLSLFVYLFYLGIKDSGIDAFKADILVKRDQQSQSGFPETFRVVREFLLLEDVMGWIRSLEGSVTEIFFENEDLKKARKDHLIIRQLLALSDKVKKLKRQIEDDKQHRENLLD